ncbi:hypothetical protein JCM8097_003784 [Rhodosporidiobolus ruineniae]
MDGYPPVPLEQLAARQGALKALSASPGKAAPVARPPCADALLPSVTGETKGSAVGDAHVAGAEQSAHEEDEENDDLMIVAYPSHAASQLDLSRWNKEVPALFPPTAYDWNVPDGLPALSKLVSRREEVFALQRTADYDDLQQRSYDTVACNLTSYKRASFAFSNPGYTLRQYASFCRSVGIPPWPLSSATIALFGIAATSRTMADGSRGVLFSQLKRHFAALEQIWSSQAAYSRLVSFPGASEAFQEWLHRDKLLGQTLPGPTSSPFEALAPPANHEELDEQEGHDDGDYSAAGTPEPDATADFVMRRSRSQMVADAHDVAWRVQQLSCPGLPQVGDAFSSAIDFYKNSVKAVLPVYGIGLQHRGENRLRCNRAKEQCPFEIKRDSQTGKVKAESIFIHNHGPDPRLISIPGWLPTVKNKYAVEAMEELVKEDSYSSDPAAFLPSLSAFLASIDPSLPPLAKPLADSGITSPSLLATLMLLEPSTRMLLLEEVERRSGVFVTDEQVDLLEEAFERALVLEG